MLESPGLVVEARALADEFASGRLHQAAGTAMRTLGMIGNINPMYAAATVGVVALDGALLGLIYEMQQYKNVQHDVEQSANFAGADITKEQILELTNTFQYLGNASSSTTDKVVSSIVQMNNSSYPVMKIITAQVTDFAEATKKELPAATEILVKALGDPAKEGVKLLEVLPNLSNANKQYFEIAKQSGDIEKMRAVLIDLLNSKMEAWRKTTLESKAGTSGLSDALLLLGSGLSGAEASTAAMTNIMERFAARTREANESAKELARTIAETPKSEMQIAEQADQFARKINPVPDRIKALNSELENTQRRMSSLDPNTDKTEMSTLAQSVKKTREELQRLQEDQSGGNVVQRTQTQIDEIKAAWVGSVRAELEAERAKWDAVANDSNIAENRREEARRKGLAITKTINDQERKFEVDTLDNNIIAAQRGSAAKIAAAQTYVDKVKALYGADSTEYVQAQRKVIEAKNEAARMGEAASKKELTQEKKDQIDAIEGEIENINSLADLHQISRQVELTELLKLEARKTAIAGEGAKSTAAITREVTRQMAQDYQQAYKQIADTAASTTTSLIFGHETLRQAAQKLIEEEVGSFIKGTFEKSAAYAAGQQAQTAAKAAGMATDKALTATTISSDAAKAGAGAYSAVAGIPIVGPVLAPVAAATAFAATEAFGSFAVGAWELPSNMIAQVHQGEMIVPAFQSGQFRNAIAALQGGGASQGGGSQTNHTWNFQGAQILDKAGLVKMLVDTMNRNPSMRPSY